MSSWLYLLSTDIQKHDLAMISACTSDSIVMQGVCRDCLDESVAYRMVDTCYLSGYTLIRECRWQKQADGIAEVELG